MPKQLDIFQNDPGRMAVLYRTSAETALKDVQFNPPARQVRHDHYVREAERLEALAAKCKAAQPGSDE
ncbi:hypothetical protein SN15_14605 [Stenotrophomonas maltophilia]|nr:hypothetical protein SN15_14605 [Stenotrophomonas maltophilia]